MNWDYPLKTSKDVRPGGWVADSRPTLPVFYFNNKSIKHPASAEAGYVSFDLESDTAH